jgi:hypothetical protein
MNPHKRAKIEPARTVTAFDSYVLDHVNDPEYETPHTGRDLLREAFTIQVCEDIGVEFTPPLIRLIIDFVLCVPTEGYSAVNASAMLQDPSTYASATDAYKTNKTTWISSVRDDLNRAKRGQQVIQGSMTCEVFETNISRYCDICNTVPTDAPAVIVPALDGTAPKILLAVPVPGSLGVGVEVLVEITFDNYDQHLLGYTLAMRVISPLVVSPYVLPDGSINGQPSQEVGRMLIARRPYFGDEDILDLANLSRVCKVVQKLVSGASLLPDQHVVLVANTYLQHRQSNPLPYSSALVHGCEVPPYAREVGVVYGGVARKYNGHLRYSQEMDPPGTYPHHPVRVYCVKLVNCPLGAAGECGLTPGTDCPCWGAYTFNVDECVRALVCSVNNTVQYRKNGSMFAALEACTLLEVRMGTVWWEVSEDNTLAELPPDLEERIPGGLVSLRLRVADFAWEE